MWGRLILWSENVALGISYGFRSCNKYCLILSPSVGKLLYFSHLRWLVVYWLLAVFKNQFSCFPAVCHCVSWGFCPIPALMLHQGIIHMCSDREYVIHASIQKFECVQCVWKLQCVCNSHGNTNIQVSSLLLSHST